MAKKSAGLLLYRHAGDELEVFLVHPGGPFWAKKDDGAWSIPKGEIGDEEDPLAAARRELTEETGFEVPHGDEIALDPQRQPGGKIVHAWALKADVDPAALVSNTFSIEWPPKSGRNREFPEVDRAAWFTLDEARRKILKGQAPFLSQIEERIGTRR